MGSQYIQSDQAHNPSKTVTRFTDTTTFQHWMTLQGLNPRAQQFQPTEPISRNQNNIMAFNQGALQAQVEALTNKVNELEHRQNMMDAEMEMMKRGGWTPSTNTFSATKMTATANGTQSQNNDQSLKNAAGTGSTSLQKNGNLFVDGHISPASKSGLVDRHAPQTAAHARSADTNGHPNNDIPVPSVEEPYQQSSKMWKPLAISRLEPLPRDALARIPPAVEMNTFSFDFLKATFGGVSWSPGLYYIPLSHGTSVLPNRTYYALDATHEPYLPEHPGAHGATLTAFFNSNPEDIDGEEASAAYENVPLFICDSPYTVDTNKRRYVYFGTYSQVRWSDKLDYDRMVEHVPNNVKMFWAEELSAVGRAEWITKAVMKHFWPMPEYEGRLPSSGAAEGSVTVDEDEEDKAIEKDIKSYVRELKDWEKEAKMKVSMIKKEFILQAFERADADDPPSLRFWWEYLQCVGWDKKFYQMLVAEQKKHPAF